MFNLDDIYEYVEIRNLTDRKFKENISHLYHKNAKWIIPFYDTISTIFFFWLRPQKNKKYFFLGSRFTHVISDLPKNEVCIIGGPRQLIYCIKNNIDYIPNGVFWTVLNEGFSIDIKRKLMQTSFGMVQRLMSLVDDSAQALLIVENDSLPIQRTFCNIATAAKIKTVCIQHGLFQSKTEAKTIDGWKCNHFICYDEHQQKIISGLGISNDKVMVGGFYEPIVKASTQGGARNIKVCFLGQPWFKYGDVYKERYMQVLDILTSKFTANNIEYSFKPHPWERDASYLISMDNVFYGSMSDALTNYDVFFSFTSTALLEATMAGKVAIQIYDEQFACDNFEKLGYSYSIKSEEIEQSILSIINNPPFALEMPDFHNLVNQIKKLTVVSV